MNAIFKKLNYKDQDKIFILNHPDTFEETLKGMAMDTQIKTKIHKGNAIEFVLAFVTKKAEIDQIIPKVVPLLKGDAVLWLAYPKKSSKKYKADFNRDSGWEVLGKLDFEGVRMVAIDQDWSALRFRHVDYIKKMTRKFPTLSKKGAKKVKGED